MYRQGDVGIFTVEEYKDFFQATPEKGDLVKRDKGRVVLAYGEVTGHAHAIASPKAEMFTFQGSDDDGKLGNDSDRFLLIKGGGADLSHEEHDTIKLPAGLFVVKRQREYGPDELRTVAD